MKYPFVIWIFSIAFSLLQKEKNKEQEEEEEIGVDSEFMKLAKKVTVKSLQKKGELDFYWSDKKWRERVQKLIFPPCLCQPAQQWWHKTQLCYPGTHLKPSNLLVTSRWVPILKNGISQHSQVSCPWIPGLCRWNVWVETRFSLKSDLLSNLPCFLRVV